MGRLSLLVVVFVTLTTPSEPRPIYFLQPRVPIILAPPTGTVIPVQLHIDPRAANRSYVLQWCDGVSAATLDGDEDSAIHPVTPLNIRVYAGDCVLHATVRGEGGKQLAVAEMTLHVCGGQEEGCIK